ncbi:MAG TPA: response regulator [Actinomycetota bacterium]|nr:response regulator [Actinomycetota bacterium]
MAKADILIVEDHATMRGSVRMLLEPEGFEIREASDGGMALEMARERPPDLMLLDLNLPGITGRDVLAQLKTDESTKDIRVIIVTATGEEGREYVLSLGADDYHTKPYSAIELLRTIERVLGGSAEPEAPAGEPGS